MRPLYIAADPVEAEILRNYLEVHGIEVSVLGGGLWGGRGELPADAWPRLCLHDEGDRERARELLRRYEHARHAGAEWTCAYGERSPVPFEICWACGNARA